MEVPEFFQSGYCRTGNSPFTPEKRHADVKSGEHFIVEDLLDFSNEDAVFADDEGPFDGTTGNSTDDSTVTVMDSCNSSLSGSDTHLSAEPLSVALADAHFSGDLCVPGEDMEEELEWLSNFVEESFSSEDMQKLQLISGMNTRVDGDASETREYPGRANPIFRPHISVPGKARSKRSRAAPSTWESRLVVLSPTSSSDSTPSTGKKPAVKPKKKEAAVGAEEGEGGSGDGRKCLHCATQKTPQWRTGPMGPKTLCNACGVRYKSGRLVPEYRPASSPTFVLTKHSNSHRKVMELRQQKELQQQEQFLHLNAGIDVIGEDDYLIHHSGPDFRQLI